MKRLAATFDGVDDAMAANIRSGAKLTGSVKDLTSKYEEQSRAMSAVRAKAILLNTAINLGIAAVGTGLVKGLQLLHNELTISAEEMNDAATAADEMGSSIEENIAFAEKLKSLDDQLKNTNLSLSDQNSIHEQMIEIQDSIIAKYELERGAIDVVNDGIRETLGLLNNKNIKTFEAWLGENQITNLSGDSTLSKAIDDYSSYDFEFRAVTGVTSHGKEKTSLAYDEYLDFLKIADDNIKNILSDATGGPGTGKHKISFTFGNADEAVAKLTELSTAVRKANDNGQYQNFLNKIGIALGDAQDIVNGSSKKVATYYYDNIVKSTEGITEYYEAVTKAEENYQAMVANGDTEQIQASYWELKQNVLYFLKSIRNSSIEGADETASYYAEKYEGILKSYRGQSVEIQLTANDSELTSQTVAALQGLAQAGYVTAGQIKSAFDGVGEEGAAQFEQITGAVELTEEEVRKFEEQLHSVSDQFNELTNGNVDYHNRPVVSAEKMWAAGWKEVSSLEQATVYTQGHDIVDAQGIPYSIEITPILENGEVLSEDALWEYIESAFNGKFNGVDDLLRLDDQKLIVHVEQGTYEDNSDVFGQLNDDLISVKESHLEAYNALNGYMTAAEGFKHIEKLAEDMGKTFAETVDYLSDMGYFGAEFSNSVVSNKAQDIIANFSGVMDVLNKARREQEALGYVTVETVQEIQGLSSTYDDISDVIEYNGEQYIFAADQANTFAEAQRKAGEKSLVEAGAIKEDILALNSYYHSLGLTATRVKEYSEEAYELQEIQKKIAEGTGFTATELETLREEYGELPAMMDETTGLFYLEATAVETLTSRFSDLIEMIIELKQQASEEFGLQTLATQLGADVNSYKVQKTYEGIMNRIQKFGIKSTEEYLKNAPDAVEYTDILDNYFATQDELALWRGIYNKEYDVPEPTDSPVNKDKSDPWKEAFEKEYQAKKHALAMEQIDQKAYLDWLDGAYKKYFSDMSKYRDEYYQYEEEVFNGRRALIDEHISDLEKEYEFLGDESKVIEELNQLLEEKKGLLSDDQRNSINSMILEYQENGIRKQIDAIEDQVELLEDREGTEDQIIECYKREINLLYDLKSVYSQIYDAGSDRMLQLDREIAQLEANITDIKREQWEAQRDAQVDALEEEQDAIEEYQDAIEDILDATVDYIKRQKEEEIDALEEARDARDEWYDNEIDRIEEVADRRKEALDDELEGYRKIIEAKKEALREEAEAEDYNDEVAKRNKEISDLQIRIDKLSLDDSKSAAAERMKLEEELATKKKELAKYQRDYSLDQQIEALDKELENFEDSTKEKEDLIDEQTKAEKERLEAQREMMQKFYDDEIERLRAYLEKEGVLRQQANELIRTQGESLWKELRAYAAEYTTDVEDLAKAWDLVKAAMEAAGSVDLDLIDISGKLDHKYNQNETTIKDLENSTYEDVENSPAAQQERSLIEQYKSLMKMSSAAWKDANAAGNESEKAYWANRNQELAKELNEKLGREALTYNKWKGIWYLDGIQFYHKGGVVGETGTLKQNELMAVLKKREVVLTEPMQETMAKYIDFAKNASFALSSLLADDPVKNIVAGLKKSGGYTGGSVETIHVEKLFEFHADNVTKEALPGLKSSLKEAADYTIRQMEDRLSRRGIKTKAKTAL